MNLIDYTYFTGDINLPANMLKGSSEVISTYIERYEKEALILLLGYDLYKSLKTEIDAGTYTSVWNGLVNGAEYSNGGYTYLWDGLVNSEKCSLIAYYIYYHVLRDNVNSYEAIGAVVAQGENSQRVPNDGLMNMAWNRFVSEYNKAIEYILINQADFPLWRYNAIEENNIFGI